jgi:hypothetical protein
MRRKAGYNYTVRRRLRQRTFVTFANQRLARGHATTVTKRFMISNHFMQEAVFTFVNLVYQSVSKFRTTASASYRLNRAKAVRVRRRAVQRHSQDLSCQSSRVPRVNGARFGAVVAWYNYGKFSVEVNYEY